MVFIGKKFRKVLRDLAAQDEEECLILRHVLSAAHSVHQQGHVDLQIMGKPDRMAFGRSVANSIEMDLHAILNSIPEESKKDFYGLVEAIDIYQATQGAVPSPELSASSEVIFELKQIRDYCMQDGLSSVY